jgi:gluconate 2-dehydrogenase gamma chain
MAEDHPDRRAFLKGLGVVGAGSVASMVPIEAVADTQDAQSPATQERSEPVSHAYTFFTNVEGAFVEAAVNQMIPADDLTPNGTDCGVAVFIDRQLAGAWGTGDRMYMQGPWQKGTPTQGYQMPLTPAEFFRAGIAATNSHCRATYQKEFDLLESEQQVQVLQGLEQGKIVLDPLPSQEFFNLLLASTMEGFFADPIYGGNRDKVSWKMLGFPGVIAIYSEHIKTYRNKLYDVEPTSIADLS